MLTFSTVRRGMWLSHGALLLSALLALALADIGYAARVILAAVAAAPLLLAVPGLRRRQRTTYQWMSVALVIYVGAAAVEVVATLGASVFSGIALFSALAELVLLLQLIREPPARPAAPPE
ncbi:MAG: DUF2069 domain-containing protein [Gammaproteobacteria bacterium]|nr:DUF2069 domain-containing protein [Gammaproteobacteria bacterium]